VIGYWIRAHSDASHKKTWSDWEMRIRKRTLCLAVLLSIALILPAAYFSGLFDVPKLAFTSSTPEFNQTDTTATVFVDPDKIVKDYLLDPGYQVGDTFQVHVNISAVADLYTWNVNITWNPAMLNFTRIVAYGDFLARTTSPYGTSRAVNIARVYNETGSALIAESTLGEYPGIGGNGRLVTVEFLIIGYGWTDLDILVAADFPTQLLSTTGNSLSFTTGDAYFRNTLKGDVDWNKIVNVVDAAGVSAHWYPGPPVGPLGYGREADINLDGTVNIVDAAIVSANWNRVAP
jgi:hypothetical protein